MDPSVLERIRRARSFGLDTDLMYQMLEDDHTVNGSSTTACGLDIGRGDDFIKAQDVTWDGAVARITPT